jgi:hypothetical protein
VRRSGGPADFEARLGVPDALRPLTDDERQSVLSGSGVRPGLPGGTYDSNQDGSGYRARGLWPQPGVYDSLAYRDPLVATALQRRTHWATTRDYYLAPPPQATREELILRDYQAEQLDYLPGGGLPGMIEQIWTRDRYGFSLLEPVLDIEGLEYRLGRLVWIWPGTVRQWVTDRAGFLAGILQRSERADAPPYIPATKLAHFARDFWGRNFEGASLLRPLIYYLEAKSEAWQDWAESARRLGRGYLRAVIDAPYGSQEWTDAEAMLDDFEESDGRVMMTNTALDVRGEHLGNTLPDIAAISEAFDYQVSRGVDEQGQQLGAQDRGSRALGTMMDQAARRSLAGECGQVCRQIEEQILRPLADLHPRFRGLRTPRLVVRGLVDQQDIATARLILEMVRDGVMPEAQHAGALEHALRLMGVV